MSVTDLMMIWADVETTGLDDDDFLLEIAVRVTTPDLETVGDPVNIVLYHDTARLSRMPKKVHDMHTASGLIGEVLASVVNLAECQRLILSYVLEHIPEPGTAPLCGSSVHFDRRFIARYLPAFHSHLSYRNIDVSTIKELVKRWHPGTWHSYDDGIRMHRATPDITASIAELSFYRRKYFA